MYAVSICPDGSSYAAGLGGGDLVDWDRGTGAERWRSKRRTPASWGEFFGEVRELAMDFNKLHFTPDGRHLIALASDRLVTIYRADTARGHESVVSDLAFLPDGSRLVSGSFDHTVKLWGADSGQELLTLAKEPHTNERVEHVLVSPDGSRITARRLPGSRRR